MGWQPERSRSRDLRIGTSERERALTLLGDHVGAGRLDLDEYEQRCDQVTTARFESELAAVFSDLPQPHPELGTPARSTRERRASQPPRGTILLWSAVAVAIVVLAVVTKQALLLVLLLLGLAVLYRRHR